MPIFETIILIIICAFFSAFFYGLWLLENDNDEFRKRHGVKPKYYRCVTKGDTYCNHEDWCNAEKRLYPDEYKADMKRREDESTN